mmetsp:Transcript_38035/g.98436  ORF Transcript_38035/g.98436 Transcript_38035/m.98436 type:complete len:509 (-) Transcript_38035:57-1583(-)
MTQIQQGRECWRFAPKVFLRSSSNCHASCCSALKSGKTCASCRKRRARFLCASLIRCMKRSSLCPRNASTTFLQCCSASRGKRYISKLSTMRLRINPSSEPRRCATERGSTLGSPLWAMALPSRMSMSGFCASVPLSSSSLTWDVHLPSTTVVSWRGSTVRGGPGTSSLRLMEGSKHLSASGGATTVVCPSLCKWPRQAVSLRWALSCRLLAFFAAPAPLPSEAEKSSDSASMYSPMNSSRTTAASTRAFCSPATGPFCSAFRSRSSRSRTSVGVAEKTDASRSMPKRLGRKSSSSNTPARRIASRAVRQATKNASTKAPSSGSGLVCLCRSCRYRQQKHVWTSVCPSSHRRKYISSWSQMATISSMGRLCTRMPFASACSSVMSASQLKPESIFGSMISIADIASKSRNCGLSIISPSCMPSEARLHSSVMSTQSSGATRVASITGHCPPSQAPSPSSPSRTRASRPCSGASSTSLFFFFFFRGFFFLPASSSAGGSPLSSSSSSIA